MTVNELIELLATYPGDLRVVVNGYEDGFDDLKSPDRLWDRQDSVERFGHSSLGW